ncbi:MAG: TonB-dependent receptor, partial [Bacteroidetes bacterium]
MRLLLFSLILIIATVVNGQDTGTLEGSIRESIGDPVEFANVALQGTQQGTMTKQDGSYTMEVPSGRSYTVIISCVGYRTKQFAVRLGAGESRQQDITLQTDIRALR